MIFDVDTRSSDSPLVQTVWRSRTEEGGSFLSTAASLWEMVITRQWGKLTLSIRGPETQATPAPVPEQAEFLGITFKHGVYMPGFPKIELVDHQIHLDESTRNTFQFLGSSWQFPNFDNADDFVKRLTRAGILSFDSAVDDALRGQSPYLSERSIQRRFLHVTGLTFKTIQQIERARRASALLQRGVPITETAYEAGYFDQAHLTNSLRRFYGQTPSQLSNHALVHSGAFFQDELAT